MSDHPGPEPEHGHETRDASISTIVFTGCILVAFGVVSLVGVWGLYRHFQRRADRANREANRRLPLVYSELEQRLAEMNRRPPHPRLEGFEPAHARVVLLAQRKEWTPPVSGTSTVGLVASPFDDGPLVAASALPAGGLQEWNFYVDTPITVVRLPEEVRQEPDPMQLYDLLPGTPVTVAYLDPQGLDGRMRVVRIEVGRAVPGGPTGPTEGGLYALGGRLMEIDPESGPDMREAAEADLRRSGWVDRDKDIAHIPIDQAMRILVDRHLLKSKPAQEGGERR